MATEKKEDNGNGLMEVSGAIHTGNLGNHQWEEIMTILSSGGARIIENGTMFKNLTEEESYVNMTQRNNCFKLTLLYKACEKIKKQNKFALSYCMYCFSVGSWHVL